MKVYGITLLLCCFSYWSTAQFALIKDADGYSNIRKEANAQSTILDTVSDGRLVFVYAEGREETGWTLTTAKEIKDRPVIFTGPE